MKTLHSFVIAFCVATGATLGLAACGGESGTSGTGGSGGDSTTPATGTGGTPTTSTGDGGSTPTTTDASSSSSSSSSSSTAASSSASSGAGGSAAAPSFSEDVQDILSNNSCAVSTCHGGAVGPNLSKDKAYDSLVGVASKGCTGKTFITKGDPAKSYLIDKLKGSPGICGNKMPAGGKPAVKDSDIAIIAAWIEAGAKND